MEPGLVDVGLYFILDHLVFGVVVALVHLPNKVEGFGFVRDDDVDGLDWLGVMLVDFKSKKEVIHVNLSICYLLGT
jgi:hypothetical protein